MQLPIHILLLSGSVRLPSYTRTLVGAIENAIAARGAATTLWDPRGRVLPIADPEYHHDPGTNPDKEVQDLFLLAEKCDAFVVASPIYHNSYSGVLKNILDHLAIPQFRYKAVGLASHGGNRSTQAVDQLRIVVRGLQGVAIPTQVCTGSGDYSPAANGTVYQLTSQEIADRIERFARELLIFAQSLRVIRSSLLHD
jgi:NAD(P)H-dependent FMN reductase